MKTNSFKIVVSAAAILLAIGGSFVSHASEKKTNIIVPGYIIPTGDFICRNLTTCSNVSNPVVCTVIYQNGNYQAYNKQSGTDVVCDILLWKPNL